MMLTKPFLLIITGLACACAPLQLHAAEANDSIDDLLKAVEEQMKAIELKRVNDSITAQASVFTRLRNDPSYRGLISGATLALRSALAVPMTSHHVDEDPLVKDPHYAFDDIGRFAPGVVLYGLKMAGLPSRSKWDEMITAHAFSTAIMVGMTGMLKKTVNETRPNLSGKDAFPSGHSAAAFMLATWLDKEYGKQFPLIKWGGYITAGAVAYSRYKHDCHWSNDVMTGAGLGIVAAEFGYAISDWLYHRSYTPQDPLPLQPTEQCWFVSAYSTMNLHRNSTATIGNDVYELAVGRSIGAKATYLSTRMLGWSSVLEYQLMPYKVNGETELTSLKGLCLRTGPQLTLPLARQFNVEAHGRVGLTQYFTRKHSEEVHLGNRLGVNYQTGVGLHWLPRGKRSYAITLNYCNEPAYSPQAPRFDTFSVGADVAFKF